MIDWRFALKKPFSEIRHPSGSTIIAQIVSSLLYFSQINFQQLGDFLNLDADAKYTWLTICYLDDDGHDDGDYLR